MSRTFLVLCLALGVPWQAPAAPLAGGKVDPYKIPGYTFRTIQGFAVLIHSEVLQHDNDPRWQRKPTEVLEHELRTITQVLPERTLRLLRRLTIWVEWYDRKDPDVGRAIAKYYGVFNRRGLWQLAKHKNPLKSNNIEIVNMRALTIEHQPSVAMDRCVLLHEMVHAVHFKLFGAQNQRIRVTYRQAMERRLYDQALDVRGRTVRPYARVNEAEYFAEISCAFLNKLHYYPFDREDLQRHDPVGYQLMVEVWGAPRLLEAAIKSDSERVAGQRLLQARSLNLAGKKDEARSVLKELIATYPNTKTAVQAKELLEQWGAATQNPATSEPTIRAGRVSDGRSPTRR